MTVSDPHTQDVIRTTPDGAHIIDGKIASEQVIAEVTERTKALAAWSMLVGALSLARAVNDAELSTEILRTAAAELHAYLA